MSLSKLISNYSEYNEWANLRILDWLKLRDKELLNAKVDSSFDTINGTLLHIFLAQKFWITFISEEDLSNTQWNTEISDFSEIEALLKDSSLDLKNRFSLFSDDDLQKELELNTSWMQNKLSRYEYIMHVINHSTYHRGQIVTISRVLKMKEDLPNTDYNKFNGR